MAVKSLEHLDPSAPVDPVRYQHLFGEVLEVKGERYDSRRTTFTFKTSWDLNNFPRHLKLFSTDEYVVRKAADPYVKPSEDRERAAELILRLSPEPVSMRDLVDQLKEMGISEKAVRSVVWQLITDSQVRLTQNLKVQASDRMTHQPQLWDIFTEESLRFPKNLPVEIQQARSDELSEMRSMQGCYWQ